MQGVIQSLFVVISRVRGMCLSFADAQAVRI